tara:strand:- start:2669 stop:4072 length:1404 start_codon:yes stop_codon:yes gene_type:complete
MNTEHRYKFEVSSKKHLCPKCSKKRFVKYIDIETSEYLPEQFGRCDRESKCGYFLNPYKNGYTKAIREQEQGNKTDCETQRTKLKKKPLNEPKISFFDFETFKQTLQPERYEKNTFIQNLFYRVQFPFEVDEVTKAIQLYRLGTVANGYRAGANTFPFIDVNGNVRAVQVKQFDKQNHSTGTDFLHSIIEKHHTRNNKALPEWLEAYNKNEIKVSCLFGEHLLSKYPYNPVALVEAPKTAVYGTLYFGLPETTESLIWLAVYNLSSLNLNKCKALKGRNVFLFPDLSKDGKAFDLWSNKASEIQKQLQDTHFQVSDLLEKLAPEQDKQEGKDIADYLIKQDWRLFRKHNVQEQPPQPQAEKVTPQQNILFSDIAPFTKVEVFKTENCFSDIKKEQQQNWSNDIAELKNYFESIELPSQRIKLHEGITITDCSLYIESHFTTVKGNNGNRTFLPYLNRLQELKQVLTA